MSLLSPRLFPLHLVGIAAVFLAGWAGWWQVGVWHDHRTDRSAELAQMDPVPLDTLMGRDDPFPKKGVGHQVTVTGTWQAADESVVKNGDQSWVVTPLRTANGSAILVVRGALTASGDRAPAPLARADTVTGWLEPSDDIISTLDLIDQVDYDLYSGYVIQRTGDQVGLGPVEPAALPKADAFTSVRNLLYGVEWWIFGAFAIFLWFRWAADLVGFETRSASAPQPPS